VNLAFCHQPLEAEFLGDLEQLIFGAAKLTREADIFGSFFKHLSQEFTPSTPRSPIGAPDLIGKLTLSRRVWEQLKFFHSFRQF